LMKIYTFPSTEGCAVRDRPGPDPVNIFFGINYATLFLAV